MRHFLLTVALLAWSGAGVPADAQDLSAPPGTPPEVKKAAKAYLDECESYDSAPSPTDKFINAVDLNDDGKSDFIIDTGEINASCFCGSGGCAIEAWVAEGGGYKKAFESNVREWQVSAKGSLPTTLIVDLHGTACGGVGADLCLKALIYQDGKLIGTTAGEDAQ